MLGGLHTEMAMLNTLGDLLGCYGRTTALDEAEVVSSGKADSFLKAAHQVTLLSLHNLLQDFF